MLLKTFEFCTFQLNTIIIGLGAGLLPMFLHRSMPFLDIEVRFWCTSFIQAITCGIGVIGLV